MMHSSGDDNQSDSPPQSTDADDVATDDPRRTVDRPPVRDEWGRDPGPDGPPPRDDREDQSSELVRFIYDIATSVFAVAVIGVYLFAISGVWPPLVAVESGSMEPHMSVNDLVFVMEDGRFPGEEAKFGVVTAETGHQSGYQQFEGYGDVIVYTPNGNGDRTPIIHRAMFWVERGENWCQSANANFLGPLQPDDPRCVAEHSGFITKGDNNGAYDQARGLSRPVRPQWVVGTAEYQLPGLGWIRLQSA